MKYQINKNGTMSITTDTVEAIGLYIQKASYEYDSTYGSYNLSFAIDKNDYEGSELEGCIGAMMKLSKESAVEKNPKVKNQLTEISPFVEEVDDDGEFTGRILFKLKQRGRVEKDGEMVDRIIPIVDSKGNDASDVQATRGSKIRVKFDLIPYYLATSKGYGVSKWIRAVQLIEPVIYEGGSDFDVVEDGYVTETKSKDEFDAVDLGIE